MNSVNMRSFGGKKKKDKQAEAKKEKQQIKDEFAEVDTDDLMNVFI